MTSLNIRNATHANITCSFDGEVIGTCDAITYIIARDQIILCKETLSNNYNGVIAEYNFLVEGNLVREFYEIYLSTMYKSFEDFLDTYDPDYEGQAMYLYFKERDAILYEDWNPVDWDTSDLTEQMLAMKEEW